MQPQLIKFIYNNTGKDFWLWAGWAARGEKDQHINPPLGLLNCADGLGVKPDPSDPFVLHIPKGTQATLSFKIPQYDGSPAAEGSFLAISAAKVPSAPHFEDRSKALLIWCSRADGEGGITFVNGATMHGIYNMNFEKDYQSSYALFLDMVKQEDGTEALVVTLELRDSSVMKHWLFNHKKQRAVEKHEESDELRKEAGKAIIMAL